jgi:arginine decarboxylase
VYNPMRFVPTKGFLTHGVGRHKQKLTSFEMALRDAGIEKYNLVRLSSIFPPHCKLITRQEGIQLLRPGQVVFAVLAEASTNEPSRMVAASIGLAIPTDPNHFGYISEHHTYGQKEAVAGEYAEDLAATMLATTLGVPFDPNSAWDERKDAYMMSGDIVRSRNVTQTAECAPDGLWTTVIAACVYVEYHE